jgi:undecaprenyl-diphosphatase
MDLLTSITLGIIEGVSEFLPISSTGHLILASEILKIPQSDFVKDFTVIIQLGAILAIVILYFERLIKSKLLWKKILTAFIPTAIIGFLLFNFIKSSLLGNYYITLIALIAGGVVLIILELLYKEKEHHVEIVENISYRNSFLIGLAQSISVIPGVSRSAATIISALFLGTKRKAAAEFSFLLAVPTMLAATTLDLYKANFSFSSSEWFILAVGFITSFFTAIIVVKWFLGYIQKHTFIPFGIYRIVLGTLFWLFLLR